LQRVLREAIQIVDFTVLEGKRGKERQNKLYEEGRSQLQYPDSKHNNDPPLAVDLAPYPIDWDNIERFQHLAGVILEVADKLNIELEWGGNWDSFKDYPHFELK
jgi:hypothetical protein